MTHHSRHRRAVMAVLAFFIAPPVPAGEPGLAVLMERMQTYTHKLQLSIEARNAPLAEFYLHELEESAAHVVTELPHYDGHPVGELTQSMLLPAIDALENLLETVEPGTWPVSELHFADLVRACNACHVATDHGHIRIARAAGNPFAQDFSVVSD